MRKLLICLLFALGVLVCAAPATAQTTLDDVPYTTPMWSADDPFGLAELRSGTNRLYQLELRTNDLNTAYGWGDWGPRVSLLEGMTNLINSALQVELDPVFEQWLLTDPGSIYALKSVVSTQVWSIAQYPLAMLAADLAAATNPIPSWIVAGDAAGSNNVTAVRSELLNSNAQARAAIDLRPTFPAVTSIVEAVAVTTEVDEIALEALAQYAAYWPKDATASSWFTFTTNANEITITGYDIGGGTNVVIPDYINGYPVTAIGDAAFSPGYAGMAITSVSGAGKVKTIGICAFSSCLYLTAVSFPQAQTIDNYAFHSCVSLATVYLGQNAPTESESVFDNATPTIYVTNPTATGWGATWNERTVVRLSLYGPGDNLTGVVKPADLPGLTNGIPAQIAAGDAAGSNNVTAVRSELLASNVVVNAALTNEAALRAAGDADNLAAMLASNVLARAAITNEAALRLAGDQGLLESNAQARAAIDLRPTYPAVTSIAQVVVAPWTNGAALGATAWQNPASATNWTWTSDGTQITLTGYTGPNDVVIPDMLDGLPVTWFGTVLNDHDAMTSVSGGENVTAIPDQAFNSCLVLASVSFPHVTTIGQSAFSADIALTNVSLPQATVIGHGAFSHCSSLKSVSFPQVIEVRDFAFTYCYSLTSVYFGQDAPAEAAEGFDVYAGSPGVTNYVTNPTATGWGEMWNDRPVVRLPVYADTFHGDGSSLTGITAAQVGAVATNAILGQGETSLGSGLTLTIGSETACYTAAPTGTWSLAVSAGALRYPRDLLIISTNGSVLPGYILDLRSGPAAATNLWYLRPFGTSTNWSLH